MGFLDDIQRDMRKINRDNQKMMRKTIKKDSDTLRKTMKEDSKLLAKAMKLQIGKELSQEKRKRLTTKRKDEVYKKYKSKCDVCPKKNTLEIHHKDMNNKNDGLSNLRLLCAYHHRLIHEKKFKTTYAQRYKNKTKNKTIPKKKVVRKKVNNGLFGGW